MKRHRTAVLMASLILLSLADASPLRAADGISVREEDGRKIFVNDGNSPTTNFSIPPAASSQDAGGQNGTPRRVKYVYWSNAEHRWKAVPRTSYSVSRARSAAAEVLAETGQAGSDAEGSPLADPSATPVVTSERVRVAIEQAAARHNVDPNLVRALIKVESNFNPRAVSRKGAMGLMQIMPGTARSLNLSHPFDPNENIDAGVRHLKQLLENFGGNVGLSLAAYNAGAGAVQRSHGIPPFRETRNYVRQITALYGSGFNLMGGPMRSPIRVSRDPEGHLVFSNTD